VAARADAKDGSCREILTGKLAGKWRVQFTHEDEFGRKIRLSRVFPTWTEAKDFVRDLRHGVKVETARQKNELTLGAWFDWLVENDWPETLADSTIASRSSRFNKYVRKEWGHVSLLRLDSIAIKTYYRNLRLEGVGQATVLELKRDLVRVFNLAIKPYHRVPWTCGNPFALSVAAPPRRDAVALTPDVAVAALRTKTLAPKERALLATFLLGGLRPSEGMALTREQLLFDQNLIAVTRKTFGDRFP
jgi:integrase